MTQYQKRKARLFALLGRSFVRTPKQASNAPIQSDTWHLHILSKL